MAGTQVERISGKRKVSLRSSLRIKGIEGLAKLFNLGYRLLFQFIERTTKLALRRTIDLTELFEKRSDFAFLSEETHTRLLHFLNCLALEGTEVLNDFLYIFLFHIQLDLRLAARLSLAFFSRPAPCLRYLVHWSSSKTLEKAL